MSHLVHCGVRALIVCVASWAASTVWAADEDPQRFVEFVQEPTATCVQRSGQQIQVKSSHPKRTVRVWLDRKVMGNGTGDRSRSTLKPGAAAEPLGCSRSDGAEQSWVIVRAEFVN
jgi:hypothetical protein